MAGEDEDFDVEEWNRRLDATPVDPPERPRLRTRHLDRPVATTIATRRTTDRAGGRSAGDPAVRPDADPLGGDPFADPLEGTEVVAEEGFPPFEHGQWTVEGEIERFGAFGRGAGPGPGLEARRGLRPARPDRAARCCSRPCSSLSRLLSRLARVPLYEYRCPICDDTFEARRPMAEASDPVDCPQGHAGSRRLLSMFASVGGASSAPAPAPRLVPPAAGAAAGCAAASRRRGAPGRRSDGGWRSC